MYALVLEPGEEDLTKFKLPNLFSWKPCPKPFDVLMGMQNLVVNNALVVT